MNKIKFCIKVTTTDVEGETTTSQMIKDEHAEHDLTFLIDNFIKFLQVEGYRKGSIIDCIEEYLEEFKED
jgi:hypothetical protein